MTFKLAAVDTLKIKVNINIPLDLGRTSKADFVAEFKKLPVSEAQELMDRVTAGDITSAQLLEQTLVSIDGLLDEDGGKIEYTEGVLAELVEMIYVVNPLIDAFMQVQFGRDILKAKNS